jgi:hypothetical protein
MFHQALQRRVGTPSPEVTESFCRVPSIWLNQNLGILYLFTCVGLGYGHATSLKEKQRIGVVSRKKEKEVKQSV